MKRQKFQMIAADVMRDANPAARRLVALHACLTGLAFLLVTAIGYGIELIPISTGLDSFGTQAVLTAIPTALKVILAVLLPFWGAGLRYAAVNIYRGHTPDNQHLLQGFRRFSAISVTVLWRIVRYALAGFVAVWGVGVLISLLPMPQVAAELLEAFLRQGTLPDTWQGGLILGTYLVCYVNGVLVFVLPLVYRHRLTGYLIVDDGELGGWNAMQESHLLMRRNGLRLLRVDLSYWWYHLLDGALLLVSFSDLLPLMGLHLPNSEIVRIALLVGAPILRLLLQVVFKPRLAVEYAGFFDSLLYAEPEESAPKQTPTPKKMPWNYE